VWRIWFSVVADIVLLYVADIVVADMVSGRYGRTPIFHTPVPFTLHDHLEARPL